MKKNKKEEIVEINDFINMFIEIDTEKKVICITDQTSKSGGGLAKRYRNKKDIMRIFGNYLFHEVNIYPSSDERK